MEKKKKGTSVLKALLIIFGFFFIAILILRACGVGGTQYHSDAAVNANIPVPIPDDSSGVVAVARMEEEASSVNPEPKEIKQTAKTFGLKADKFRKQYNAIMSKLKSSYRMPALLLEEGAVNDTFKAALTPYNGMFGSVDKDTKNIKSVTVTLDKEGMTADTLVATTIIAASIDKGLGDTGKDKEFIIEMFEDAMKQFGQNPNEHIEVERKQNGRMYICTINQTVGVWFSIRPVD